MSPKKSPRPRPVGRPPVIPGPVPPGAKRRFTPPLSDAEWAAAKRLIARIRAGKS